MEQEIFQRKQFTFYESFYNCIEKTLRKKSEKLAAYEALIQYALYGTITEKENIPPAVFGLLEAFYPVLNTARRNAKNGKQGGEAKQTPSTASAASTSKKEKEKEIEKEIEIEKETETKTETETKGSRSAFEWFWSVYPKKINKEDAYKAFCGVTESVKVLVEAVKRQKESLQWQKEGGRYIPNPTNWLTGKRWTDNLPTANDSAPLSDLDLAAIERMMSGKGFT